MFFFTLGLESASRTYAKNIVKVHYNVVVFYINSGLLFAFLQGAKLLRCLFKPRLTAWEWPLWYFVYTCKKAEKEESG